MNTSHHRQAILIFGIVIPFVVILAIAIASFIGHTKLQAKFAQNVAALERYQTAKTQSIELDGMLSQDNRREKITYWNSKLEQDLVQSLTQNLNKILSKYDSEVLRQTEMGQAGGVGGIGTRTDHPNSRMQLSFEGGFKPMQMLLAELENEMPHLLLESISVRPQPAKAEGQKPTLQFGLIYLCWEKPKE